MDSEHQQLMGALKELAELLTEQTRSLDTIAAQLLAIRADIQPRALQSEAAAPRSEQTPEPRKPALDNPIDQIPRRQAPRI